MEIVHSIWGSVTGWLTDRSIGTFLLGILATLFAQRSTAYWSRLRSIDETKLKIYMSWMPHIADWYVEALSSPPAADAKTFQKKKQEILGTLQIMGPDEAMLAFELFSGLAEMAFNRDPDFNREDFDKSFSQLNYILCCEIHREKLKTPLTKVINILTRSQKAGRN